MYSDPAVRESEIKNMSEIYQELKGEVLPELRRARFIANVEYKNYTPEELTALVNDNINVLDEEALLHVASPLTIPQRRFRSTTRLSTVTAATGLSTTLE